MSEQGESHCILVWKEGNKLEKGTSWGERGGAAESGQEEAGWLARSLAVSRKGWEGPGGGHLQPPWPLCTPLC